MVVIRLVKLNDVNVNQRNNLTTESRFHDLFASSLFPCSPIHSPPTIVTILHSTLHSTPQRLGD